MSGKNIFDFRKILNFASFYRSLQKLIGSHSRRFLFVNEYVKPRAKDRILEIGCGVGDLLEYLPKSVHYEGFDMNPRYIREANRLYGKIGTFHCVELGGKSIEFSSDYDLVLVNSVFHHLNDSSVIDALKVAETALKPKGRLVIFDWYKSTASTLIVRLFQMLDRGKYIRSSDAYECLISKSFTEFQTTLIEDTGMIPYPLIFFECIK